MHRNERYETIKKMHGINHLFAQHGLTLQNSDKCSHTSKNLPKISPLPTTSYSKYQDKKLIQEMLNHQKIQLPNDKFCLHERQTSRGSVSSTYFYGPIISYETTRGINRNNCSLYCPPSGFDNHLYNYHSGHRYYQTCQKNNSSDTTLPFSSSPTNIDHEKQQQQHHHNHHSIQEMIKHLGKRLGHIRRQSECQESPKKREEDFRNRSQSLDGAVKHPTFDVDCETTYKIYESILRQGNAKNKNGISKIYNT